ncbi:hypothetical protein [Nocardia jiangxiensis]|uniref:hypothetical protein n=1 Tax=Nocardia jiangxiensis TaxID=282685 RepID=UPI0002EB3AD9|nr:hypothetical protein [Nocardia jiangxiensis]
MTSDEFGLDPLELPKLGDETELDMPHHIAGASRNLYRALIFAGFDEEQALQLVGMTMRYTGDA